MIRAFDGVRQPAIAVPNKPRFNRSVDIAQDFAESINKHLGVAVIICDVILDTFELSDFGLASLARGAKSRGFRN